MCCVVLKAKDDWSKNFVAFFLTGMSAEPVASINQCRYASHGEALIELSESILIRRAPLDYTYIAGAHVHSCFFDSSKGSVGII